MKRLEDAKDAEPGTKEGDAAFEQAMEAAKLCADLIKIDDAREEQERRREMDEEKQTRDEKLKARESVINTVVRGVEIVGTIVLVPTLTYVFNKRLATHIGTVEQFETYTTTPGRSLGKMFKFGK